MGWWFIQVRTWFRPGRMVVIVMNGGCRCWTGAKHPERTHVKLRGEASLEEGSVADSIRGNLYCLARELPFWWCGRVSLLITQVKQRRAWSVLGWVTATRYNNNYNKIKNTFLIYCNFIMNMKYDQILVLHVLLVSQEGLPHSVEYYKP
jgi:hypothetical protein